MSQAKPSAKVRGSTPAPAPKAPKAKMPRARAKGKLATPALHAALPRLTVEVGPLLETQWTGIPVFTRRLVQALLRDGRLDLSFSFNLATIPAAKILSAIRAETGVFLRQDLEEHAFYHSRPIDPAQPALYPSVKKSFGICQGEASTVHDISTLVMPENHEESNILHHMEELEQELASNQLTFCVSAATEAVLHNYYPSTRGRTSVLPQYVDWPEHFALMHHNQPPIRLGRYAVVIGTIEPRKNLALLLRALQREELRKSDLKFVVIGKVGWLVDQFLDTLTPAQRERIVFSGFVSEFIKYRLIAAAEFLVFPSLYEGFGIPALEALSLGKPVLAAHTSSFPEVIGPAGVYFDPLSLDEFCAALTEIETPSRLNELSALARPQAAKFTPQRMAEPVVKWVMGL
jgi:glycosyltransferase involved in cell wall biosynthesis